MVGAAWNYNIRIGLLCCLIFCIVSALFPISATAQDDVEVTIHYKPMTGDTQEWDLWVWTDRGGEAFAFTDEDEFGKVARFSLPSATTKVNYLVRLPDWSKQDCKQNRELEVVDGKAEVWLQGGTCEVILNQQVLRTSPLLPDAGMGGAQSIHALGVTIAIIALLWTIMVIIRKKKNV